MAKDSRLAEIFRQELKKDKGLMSAFLAAAGERGKERSDIRNILPKSGISGAIAERMFGKSYRASNKDTKVERTSGDITSSKYLPGMAKDMNLMRLNMQKLVTLAGGKPSKTVSTGLLKGKDTKIAEKKESGGMLGTAGNMLNGAASMAGAALGGIGKLGGGILSMGGSMLGGIASGIGNIGGSILGGLTGILGSLGGGFLSLLGGLVSFGLPGMLIALGAGSLISAIFTSFDFKSLGGIFTDTFDGITKVLQDFFGVNKEENKDKSFIRLIAETLDEKFETTKFTESLDYIGKKLKSITDTLEVQIRSVYVTIQNHAKAAFTTFADIMLAVGSDIKGITTKWFDENMVKIYTLVGTLIGGVIGSIIPKVGTAIGATIGGTLGAATAFTIQKEQSGGENDRTALANIQKRLDDKSAPGTREFDEKRVIELKKRIADRDVTYSSNNLELMRKQGLGNTFNTHLASEYEKNPLPTSPTKIPGSNVSGTGGSYNDRIARGESGGKYDTIFGKAGGAMINGKLVTENTIDEVIA
jgi:gas vesicle protein